MKFFAPTEEPIHIALTTGHTAVITQDGNELDTMFRREAIARGALTEGETASAAPQASDFDRKQVITDAMNEMMDGEEEGDFNDDGKPNLTKLNARVGFKVSRSEADAIFEAITKAQPQD